MKNFLLLGTSLWVALISLMYPIHVKAQVSLDKTGWSVVFEDDFNDPNTIGPNSTKWSLGYHFTNNDDPRLDDNKHYANWDNVVVHDGVADFVTRPLATPIVINGKDYTYSTGAISCKFNDTQYSGCIPNGNEVKDRGFLYGMFEIKCRMPSGTNRLAAFWLTGAVEDDVFEYNSGGDGSNIDQPNAFSSTIHKFGTDPRSYECSSTHYNVTSDLNLDYHVYTLVWTKTSVTYFVDGREVRTDTDPNIIPQGCDFRRMIPCVDAEVGDGAPDYQDGNTYRPYSVDYVRVYKPTDANDRECTQTPYRTTLALNSLSSLNSNAYGTSKTQDACYSYGSVPTRDIDLNTMGQVFFQNTSGNMVRLAFNNSSSQWDMTVLDGSISNVSANITCSKSASNVYYSDSNNRMWNIYYDNGWHSACLDGGVTNISNNVVVANTGSNIFYRNTSGNLSNFYYNGNWQNSSISQVTNISSCLGSIAVYDNFLFYKSGNGSLYYVEFTSSGWSQPNLISAANNVGNSIVIQKFPTSGIDGLKIYYIGSDNIIYNTYRDNGQWVSYPLSYYVHNASSDLVLYQGQLFYKSFDNRLFNFYFYEGKWFSTPIQYNNSPDVKGSLGADGFGKIFFQSTDNAIWNAYSAPSKFQNLPCKAKHAISNRTADSTISDVKSVASSVSTNKISALAVRVSVYDVCGRLVRNTAWSDGQNTDLITSDLPTGFYIMHFHDENKKLIRVNRVVVQ